MSDIIQLKQKRYHEVKSHLLSSSVIITSDVSDGLTIPIAGRTLYRPRVVVLTLIDKNRKKNKLKNKNMHFLYI